MRGLIIPFVLVLLLSACRDAFEFDYNDVLEPQVVIDGYITDMGRRHEVRVSMSTTINRRGQVETQFVDDAIVRIEDDLGGFTVLNYTESGLYVSQPAYAAQEGRSYTLSVTLAGGEEYVSEVKSLPPSAPAVAQLSVEADTRPGLVNNQIRDINGASISARIAKDENRHFYQWIINTYFVRESVLAPDELRFCYVQNTPEASIELLQDNPISGGPSEYTYELSFVTRDVQMRYDFGFEARLLTLNEEDYNFWNLIKSLSESSGGLFDAAPFSIEGNVTNPRTGDKALGYFGVYRESVDRVFFNELEIGYRMGTYADCSIPPLADRPHACEDCRLWLHFRNLGTSPPIWWRN